MKSCLTLLILFIVAVSFIGTTAFMYFASDTIELEAK